MSEVHAAAPPDRGRLSDSLATAAEHLRRITARVETRGRGIGSATIWRPDGWIATNAHVAHHPVSVVLDDGRRFSARVVRRSPESDLAAIKIDADGLPSARIGDSDALAVGELVLAAGYPFGLSSAVTAGIVHAIGVEHDEAGRDRFDGEDDLLRGCRPRQHRPHPGPESPRRPRRARLTRGQRDDARPAGRASGDLTEHPPEALFAQIHEEHIRSGGRDPFPERSASGPRDHAERRSPRHERLQPGPGGLGLRHDEDAGHHPAA